MLVLWPGGGQAAQSASAPPTCDTPSYEDRYCRFQLEGWTVELNAALIRDNPSLAGTTLDGLRRQLKDIVGRVPAVRVAELRRITVWIEPQQGPGDEPQLVHHPTGSTWPEDHGYPPAQRGSIKIRNAQHFVNRLQGVYAQVLHEFAHAYHEVILGFDDRSVANAFENAIQTGLHQSVAYKGGGSKRSYALTNHKEYFAELSEAYFGSNDYFPFNRAELQSYDPIGFAAVRAAWEDTVPVVMREAKGIDRACESPIASPQSDRRSRLTIRNGGDAPIKLFWVDLKGALRHNRTIAPGALGTLWSSVGHRFVITDAKDSCLATATAESTAFWIDILP
jgi:hypothetical protein